MSTFRARVALSVVWAAVACSGCGKSQPQGANQVAAAPAEQVIQGTVTYEPSPAQAPGAPAANGPAPVSPPTVGAPAPAPNLGAPATAPSVGSPGQPPAAGAPNAAPAAPPQAFAAGTDRPAASAASAPGVATAPVTQTAPGAAAGPAGSVPDSSPTQAKNTAGAAKSDAVASGNVPALAGAINLWRAQGTNLVGAKRLTDKPVIAGYSWMVHLLPYLGHNDIYGKFDFNKQWHDVSNLPLACEAIPAFLDPANANRRMTIVGVKKAIGPAFTHYVGMAGVEDSRNLVAAELPRSDPRAGIFGYDQVARPDEITDGSSNTIMLIGAGKIVGPWVSGGGATVRGARAPYFDDVTGFASATDPGAGVVAAMADGSVKRISKDIDPAVFRALCTIHGAEKIDMQANSNFIHQQQ